MTVHQEPPTSARRSSRERRPQGPWGALLALPVVALVIPGSLVLAGPLRSNGWPARLLVFWIASMVVLGWIARRPRRSPLAPGRVAPAEAGTWLLIIGLLAGLGGAFVRDLSELEAAGTLRFALVLFPLAILAVGISTLADSRRADLLLAGLLVGATIGGLIAIAQFVVPFDWAGLLQVPPLQSDDPSGGGSRGGFTRISGAAGHAIELGVISGAALPLGMHMARFAATRQARVLAAIAVAVLVVSIPLSVSRSGVLVAILAVGIYAVSLDNRQRLTVLVLALAGLAVFRAAVPGLLGTVVAIFGGASTDDSITGRTEDYALVNELWREQPVLGHGLGTFRPEEYFFLDNQYLMALVEGGVPLLAATIAFFLLAMASARGAVRRASHPEYSSRGQAVLASIVAIAISGTFFDLFSFEQVTVMTFVLTGVAGAIWRHGVASGHPLPMPAERFRAAMSSPTASR
ncbi:O-antigen ligase family protein [Georgenia sp. Z1491]|uniref:O-antigen ligase family protein n=1 Tax=Georgenia sp. Z1491 TaxID=3416707 RepID=UPI003CEF80B5